MSSGTGGQVISARTHLRDRMSRWQTSVWECHASAGLWAWQFERVQVLTFIDDQRHSSGSSNCTTLELATQIAAAADRCFSRSMCHLCQWKCGADGSASCGQRKRTTLPCSAPRSQRTGRSVCASTSTGTGRSGQNSGRHWPSERVPREGGFISTITPPTPETKLYNVDDVQRTAAKPKRAR